jgi:hypothetical protein
MPQARSVSFFLPQGYTASNEKASPRPQKVRRRGAIHPPTEISDLSLNRDAVMSSEKPLRRLPLRQVLASCDKVSRELSELVHTGLMQRIADCRDLSRPVRRRSHYPSVVALQNGLRRLTDTHEQTQALLTSLCDHLDAIRDHAQREQTMRR